MTNIIRHAYGGRPGPIRIFLKASEDSIEVLIEDAGKPFDPTRIQPPDLPPKKPGGLGVYFIKTLFDRVGHEALPAGGNRLRLVKFK